MIYCIDGIMGSGKSYYAVDFILSNSSKYFNIYTNIEGFKHGSLTTPLTYEFMNTSFISLYSLYKSNPDIEDSVLISKLVDLGILSSSDINSPSLFVIDEAHNLFDKKLDWLLWLVTYHRHLHLDFLLITQTYSLMHTSYHKLIQKYVHALPQDRMLFKTHFKYQYHISVPYYSKNTLERVHRLKLRDEVFSAYISGDKVRSKSVLSRYFIYIAIFIVVAFIMGTYLFGTFFGSSSKSSSSSVSVIPPPVNNVARVNAMIPSSPSLSPASHVRSVESRKIDSPSLPDSSDMVLSSITIWNDEKEFILMNRPFPLSLLSRFRSSIDILSTDKDDFRTVITCFIPTSVIDSLIPSSSDNNSSSDSFFNPF